MTREIFEVYDEVEQSNKEALSFCEIESVRKFKDDPTFI